MWRVKSLDAILATAEKKSLHRSLGPIQLTLLGIGAVIGTGIFVLTAAAAQKAGPGMMWSFVIAGAVCAMAAPPQHIAISSTHQPPVFMDDLPGKGPRTAYSGRRASGKWP